MIGSLLQQIFSRSSHPSAAMEMDGRAGGWCRNKGLGDVIDHVVDKLDSRLRLLPNHARALEEPLATTFRHIDEVAESICGPLLCSQSTFSDDPLVNAFFVNPQHLQEVFSHSEELRRLFKANPLADDCWGLLCMHKQERTQPGFALVNDDIQRDVMQTSVSFTDHQIVSPGIDEGSARCALKCCLFDGLLAHIQHEAARAERQTQSLESRLQGLNARLRRLSQQGDPNNQQAALQAQIQDLQKQLSQSLHLGTIKEQLDFAVSALSHPAEFLTTNSCSLRLNRQALKLDSGSTEPGNDLVLSEIHIASHPPRIGTLVRFRRDELLPQPDVLKQAELFLAV